MFLVRDDFESEKSFSSLKTCIFILQGVPWISYVATSSIRRGNWGVTWATLVLLRATHINSFFPCCGILVSVFMYLKKE